MAVRLSMPLFLLLSFLLSPVCASTENEARGEMLVIFAFFGMALGAVVTFILNRLQLNLPYTVVLLVLGLGMGEWSTHEQEKWVEYGDAIRLWQGIDPELIFYSFLPVLIFGDAQSLNWHHVKASVVQSLLLAGPGVLIGAFFTGIFMYFAMPLDWSWYLCMVFGAVLSATDPVAVVSLLHDAGAPSSLTILIIGESLLNDGTAIVLFKLYFSMMEGDTYSAGDVIVYFIQMMLGSPAVGVLFGLVGVFCLSMASKPTSRDDVTIQTAASVCCAYFVFFFAEYECGLSGVLATATAGVMFAWLSPTTIINQAHMDHIWNFAEWLGNTLIFLLTGLLIGTITTVSGRDWWFLIVIYIYLSVLRCGIIVLLYPILSRVGLPVSVNDALFISFAGLRGALACALGLIVRSEYEELGLSQEEADRVFFYIAGVASLTLVINATAANFVLEKLGLLDDQNTATKRMTVHQVCHRLRSQILAEVEKSVVCKHTDTGIHWSDLIQYNTLLQQHDRDVIPTKEEAELAVQELCEIEDLPDGIDVPNKAQARWKAAIKREISNFQNRKEQQRQSMRELYTAENQILMYCRSMFLSLLRAQYWELIRAGKLPRNNAFSTQILLYSVDVGIDHVGEPISGDWSYVRRQRIFSSSYNTSHLYKVVLTKTGRYLPTSWRRSLQLWSTRQLFTKVQILLNFIEAHENAQAKYDDFLRPNGVCDVASETQVSVVIDESKQAVEEARNFLCEINHVDVVTIATVQAGHSLLHRQTELISSMVKEGLLDGKSSEEFLCIIDHDMTRLNELKEKREMIAVLRRRSSTALLNLSKRFSVNSFNEDEEKEIDSADKRDESRTEVAVDLAPNSSPCTQRIGGLKRRSSDSRIELKKFEEALQIHQPW